MPEGEDAPLVSLVRPAAEDGPDGALIMLHGRGVHHSDLFPLLDELDPDARLLGATPGAPIVDPATGGRHWYVVEQVGQPDTETFLAGAGSLAAFCDGFLAEHGIGWDRTVIGGFSQGGAMALATGLRADGTAPAGIIVMSSFLPHVEGWPLDLGTRSDVPIWISHGSMDPVIAVDFGRNARSTLEGAGLKVTYSESPVAHGIDPRLVPELRAWLGERLPGQS